MTIENRNLTPGTQLVARFKKEQQTCSVEQGEGGKLVFVLGDGSRHKSPSAAGSAVMGGTACNGWRFWTPKAEQPTTADQAPAPPKGKRSKKLISRVANQKGAPEGERRYFCGGCMAGFTAPAGGEPRFCPAGHSEEDQSA